MGQLTYHRSQPFAPIRNISVPWTDINTLGKALFINPSYARSGYSGFLRVDPLFASGKFPDPRFYDQDRVSVPRMATVVTRFSETFEGWGFKALSIGAPAKMKKHRSYLISSRISYHTVISVLPNGLLPHGAHYAGLPRRARCGAVEAPDGLMPDASCLAR